MTTPAKELLRLDDLRVHFATPEAGGRRSKRRLKAVDGVDLVLNAGETVGLVGESGCGKSTVAKAIMGLVQPTSGSISFDGVETTSLSQKQMRSVRRQMQLVFQDPFSSLDPRMTVEDVLLEPLQIHGLVKSVDTREFVEELLQRVGMSPAHAGRYPHEFSGGQRQRIGIARALALRPKVLILDEPVSALDASIQAQIINLLARLQRDLGLAYLFIAHDLAVVRHVSHRVAVMYLGKIVEQGTREQIYAQAQHPYTQALLSAAPIPDPEGREARRRILLEGDLPSAADPPSGCRFRTRCWKAQEVCSTDEPTLGGSATDREVACHFPEPLPTATPVD